MSSGWGCPHEYQGRCQKVEGKECDPGMKGCIMHGRFRFSNPAKNAPASVARRLRQGRQDKPLSETEGE